MFLEYKFYNVAISSVQPVADPGNLVEKEEVKIRFTKVDIKYVPTSGGPVMSSYNFSQKKK